MNTVSDPLPTSQELEPRQAPVTIAVRPVVAREHDEVFSRIDLVRSLFLHRTLAIAIFATGLIAAVLYIVFTGPVYTAQSQVYVQPSPPRLMQPGSAGSWPYDATTYESYIQQQIQNMTRDDVLAGAVKKMRPGTWKEPEETDRQAAERLGRSVKVVRLGSSYQVSIAAHAETAELAADVSNALAASFVERAKSDLRAGDPERIELLREERERILKALADDRDEQEELNKRLGVATINNALPDPYDDQIRVIRAELVKARAASDEATARLTTVNGNDASSSNALDAEADELITSDPGLVSMKTSLNQRRATLVTQMANLTPNHPQYKQDADELANINTSLSSMMQDLRGKVSRNIQQRLKNDLERTSMVEARLNAQLGQLTGAAGGAVPRLQRSTELATDIQRLQNRFTAVDEQFRNLTMENKAPGAAFISSAAVPAIHQAIFPIMRRAGMLALGSLFLAIIAAIAAHNLDPHIYIAKDVERVLGFSPMAQLPDFRQVSEEVNEEYLLRLAGAIEHAFQQGGLKSCIVTGVSSGAGVTTVASRVTGMLEGMGRSTVLVDASSGPQASSESETGIASTSCETMDLVKIAADTHPRSLLQQMANGEDSDTIVLTDTAPLLASGETEYLARFVDTAIVVIQSGLSTRAQLREVAQTLQRLEVTAVGFVLNRVSIQKANRSFRQSVRAVERRLAAQNRLRAPHLPRTQPSAEHRRQAQEPSVVAEPDSVKFPDPSLSPDPSLRARVAEQRVAPPSRPAPIPELEPTPAPRVPRGRGIPPRPATASRPVTAPPQSAAPPPPSLAYDSAPPVAPSAPPQRPESAPVTEPLSAPIPPARPLASPSANVNAVRPAPPSPASQESQPLPVEAVQERDDSGYTAASRLGGLRNLLVSLGRKSLNNEGDASGEPDIEPRFERATVRPAYTDEPLPAAEAPDSSAPTRLTAQPEFLPPKPIVEVEKGKETVRPTPPRRENPDPEDIQTLPSWRGQYRKKRYPNL